MPSLQQAIEAKRSGEKPEPSCVTFGTRGSTPFVEFQVTPHSRSGFPVAQLCHYTLEANAAEGGDAPSERLTFGFPTADVVVLGARLGKLVEAITEQSLAAVVPLDARYQATLGRGPWVASIAINRIDKPGGAAG